MGPTDVIIILILIVVLGYAVYHVSKKAIKKESCCGTTVVKIKRKKLKAAIGSVVLSIGDMHCVNCQKKIMDTVNAMEGIALDIDLKAGEGVLSYEKETDINGIVEKIKALGYECRRKA